MSIYLPNGVGDYPVGDSLGYAKPLQTSGNVWYVESATGTDAVSPAGLNASKPLATLGQAVSNAADNDIVVLLQNHSEALTSALTINKSLIIVGTGAAAGIPRPTFSRTGGAAANLFNITAAGVQLRSILFGPTLTSAVSTAMIAVSGARFRMVGCYVLQDEFDTGPALLLSSGADRCELRNCTFENDSDTTQPESAIKNGAALTDVRIYGTTVDAGSVGWSNFYAIDLSAGAVTRIEIEGLTLLNGADLKLHASSTGFVHVEESTGGSRVDW